MLKFFADENISFYTVDFIRKYGYDVKSVKEEGMQKAADEEVAGLAAKENRILLTFDLDFGELYYFSSKIKNTIIILRLESQWHENVNRVLKQLLDSKKLETEDFENSLIIITENRYRIRKK